MPILRVPPRLTTSILYRDKIILLMLDAVKVKQLEFSDLYLGHSTLEDRFSDVPGAAANPLPAGPLLRDDLDQLTAACKHILQERPTATEFKTVYDDVAYRVSVMTTASGEVFVLRKISEKIHSLSELGIPHAYIRYLMTRDLTGLFIISGAIKAGKTTTACAMIKDRLTAYGGVAVSTEETIELPLEGSYGDGICYQTSFHREIRSSVDTFRRAMKWGAKIILIDEIRDHEIATEALQASINGHLVITTMLAANVIQTINKLHALTNEKLAPGAAQSLVADGLIGVLHQQLMPGPKQKLETEFLFLKDAVMTKAVLRNGKYDLLGSDIKRQMAAMITGNATAQRFLET
ncbi:ATPase, T2SS/T4P/T4SS family [Undibacterium sp. SXout7W]|uniref:ATPase, T2SS/T4P/T4SS family n=1 Tax=Undibacterium sp. SXout7W TaxID=3413049 RepID=UPI003BF3A2DE